MNDVATFLLVEDNEDHAELIRFAFEDSRLLNRLEHVLDGERALQFLRQEGEFAQKPRPDVILLDINLPKKSGLDVLKEIKADASLRSIPVVMLTTSETERDRMMAYGHSANSYVVKPVDLEKLQEVVKSLQMYWGICNAPPPQ